MSQEERKAVRRAQAAVRARVPGWRDLTADLLLAHGCGPPEMARAALHRLSRRPRFPAEVGRPPRPR